MRKRERGMDPRPWIRSYVPARHRSKRKRKVNIHLRFMATCESYEVFRGGCQRYFTLVDTQSSSVLRYLLYWWIDSQRFVLKGRGSCVGSGCAVRNGRGSGRLWRKHFIFTKNFTENKTQFPARRTIWKMDAVWIEVHSHSYLSIA